MARAGVAGFDVNIDCLGINQKIVSTAETALSLKNKAGSTSRLAEARVRWFSSCA